MLHDKGKALHHGHSIGSPIQNLLRSEFRNLRGLLGAPRSNKCDGANQPGMNQS
jgi:hypothetical protein